MVYDFRGADVAAGGQGAPLAPAYHQALARSLTPAPEGPLVVLNLGGVANVTWVNLESNELIAFDTGPGNGLLDEWMTVQTGQKMDEDGTTAAKGAVDPGILKRLLDNEYFKRPAPKSIDRHDFGLAGLEGLSAEDGAALLAQFTAQSVALARQHFPSDPNRWLVCGGGRHNPVLMTALSLALGMAVEPVETVGWRGDSLEAEAFGFLATAAANLLPISFPRTTGAPRPLTGGRMTST